MKSHGADSQYGPARLVQVIGNFMGGCVSVGLGSLDELDCDNGDNGTYFICPEKLVILSRKHAPAVEQMTPKHRKGVLEEAISKSADIFLKREAA